MKRMLQGDRIILLALALIVVLLGGNYVAVKFSNVELAPFWGAAVRFAVAAFILFAIVRVRKIALPKGEALKGAMLFGVLSFGATYGLLYWSLLELSAGAASVILATIPLMTLLMAAVIGLEKLTLKGLIAAGLVIIGIGVVFHDQLAFQVPLLYPALAFACAFTAALSAIVIKYYPKSNPVATNTVAMAAGAVLLFMASIVTRESMTIPTLGATWGALGWLLISTIVAFVLMVWILSQWTASATVYALVLAPLVTVVAAALLLDEALTSGFLLGGAIVLIGVYISVLMPARRPKQ